MYEIIKKIKNAQIRDTFHDHLLMIYVTYETRLLSLYFTKENKNLEN